MTEAAKKGKAAYKKILGELNLSENAIIEDANKIFKKETKEIFDALKIIWRVGLFHWFNEDCGIYDRVTGQETTEDLREIVQNAIDAVRTGAIFPAKTEILLRYAKSDSPIIILGETGTGKELLAHAIHQISDRNKRPFIRVNSAVLTESLFESEMFGHEKGAFTGAISEKKGLLQAAEKGTFFLDELGKMPKSLQGKLLRVIEDGMIRKVGDQKEKKIDVRFIVALQQEEIDKEQVLEDLLTRLKYPDAHRMPSLNQELKKHGWKIIDNAKIKVIKELIPKQTELSIDKDLMDFLLMREYKGNYRELENILHHAIMHRDPSQMDRLTKSCIQDLPDKHAQVSVSDRTYPTMKLSTVLSEATDLEALFIEEKSVLMKLDYEKVDFAEIVSRIEKLGSLIVKGMVMHLSKNGIDFKKAMSASDLSLSAYQTHLKDVAKILGMNASAYVKEYKKTHAT